MSTDRRITAKARLLSMLTLLVLTLTPLIEAPPAYGDSAATASGVDGRIAFVRGSDLGMTDVASIRPNGKGLVKITDSKANELYVDVSPNGRRVAFTRFTRNGGEIFTAPIGGGPARRLTSNKVHEELPIWSPDSRRIAFVGYPRGEDDGELFVINADGTGRMRVTRNDLPNDADPRWSPDGRRLLFNSGSIDDDAQDLYIVTIGEPGETVITQPGVNDTFGEWSPDGESVVYASYRNEQWDLYEATLDEMKTTRLTDDPKDDFAPEWSPDGTRIVFVRGRLEGNVPSDEVFVMNSDGSDQMSVSPGRLQAFSPDWAPSGNRIVFIGQVNVKDEPFPGWEIFRVNSDGSGLTRLTRTKAQEFDPEWAAAPQ